MAGIGLARIVGGHFRRAQLGVAVWGATLALGMTQAAQLFAGWPDSGAFISAFSHYLGPGERYLVEAPEVPIYYLMSRPDAQLWQFGSTYVIFYTDSHGETLTGDAGFAAAIRDGYYQVIVYNGVDTPPVDAVIAHALQTSSLYRLAQIVPSTGDFANVPYYIWVRR